MEILYFLAGPMMHHPGVVNNTKEVFLSARVVSWGIIISVVGIDISGCTRHFDFYYNKNGLSHALTNRHTWRFFLFLYQIKKHVNSGKLVGQEPWVAICERGKRSVFVGFRPRDKIHEE
ncbi:hypothetical protein AT461_003568 [Escherichia coli]|nr:hypothetical protein [Escherichia coli]